MVLRQRMQEWLKDLEEAVQPVVGAHIET
jgi:hypothetical protein